MPRGKPPWRSNGLNLGLTWTPFLGLPSAMTSDQNRSSGYAGVSSTQRWAPLQRRDLNRSGFLGGSLSWVGDPGLVSDVRTIGLRPWREGRCRSERLGGGGFTSRPTLG